MNTQNQLILALDSCAKVASVAVCRGDTPLWSKTLSNGYTHSENLLPMIEEALASLSLKVCDIDVFACSSGPGSFTGVRIGVATVKGLAFGKNKPCVSVSALEALAENLKNRCGIICAAMDARRSQVYTAIFESDGKNLKRLCDDKAISAAELCDELAKYSKTIYVCGDGYDVVVNEAAKSSIVLGTVTEDEKLPNAVSVAKVALRSRSTSDVALSPTYLRLPQAERERNERIAREKQNNI